MASEPGSPTTEHTAFLNESVIKYPKRNKEPQMLKFGFVCIICTIVNIYFSSIAGKSKTMTFRDMTKLRRPNQFVGLDRVNTLDHVAPPALIYPTLLSQINQAEPGRAYGDDPIKFAAWKGATPPVDRELKVTAKVSTIVEFRAIDFGMENCELAIITPATTSLKSPLALGSGENRVDIWTLKVPYAINSKTLSWNNRPSRLRKVDTVTISHGMNYTYRFGCPLDSLHAFELSAVDDSAYVEWSQSRKDPNPAVVVMQYASNSSSLSASRPSLWKRVKEKFFDPRSSLSWSIPELEHVTMRIIPSSSHYHMESLAWKNLLPHGGHIVHIGHPDGTVSTHTVAMFHQLRCLDILRTAYLDDGSHRESLLAQHCLNYIRQTVLCQMDMRSEPQSTIRTHNGVDMLCHDWEPIYKEASKNFEAYSRHKV